MRCCAHQALQNCRCCIRVSIRNSLKGFMVVPAISACLSFFVGGLGRFWIREFMLALLDLRWMGRKEEIFARQR